MFAYILRRIGMMIPVVLGVLIFVFIVNRMSGDPVAAILGAEATEEQYAEERARLGLDDPLPVQFFTYVKQIVTKFDIGISYDSRLPVSGEILKRLPLTLSMAAISLAAATVIGIVFGVLCAINQNTKIDYILTFLSLIATSLPNYWIGLMLILFFSVNLGWFPPSGVDSWMSWILPCVAMGMNSVANMCRTTRSSMLEVIRQDYIRTAKSKGISNERVIFKHALKNAVFPVITVFGVLASVSVGGQVIIETVFALPGIGSYMMSAITFKNYPVIQGTVLVLSLIVCVINLLVDIAYGFADPRIRAKYSQRRKKLKAVKA